MSPIALNLLTWLACSCMGCILLAEIIYSFKRTRGIGRVEEILFDIGIFIGIILLCYLLIIAFSFLGSRIWAVLSN